MKKKARNKFFYKIGLAMLPFFLLFVSIIIIIGILVSSITAIFPDTDRFSKEDKKLSEKYKKIGVHTKIDYSQMIIYDAVKNKNDFTDVKPQKTALKFLIIDFTKYVLKVKTVEQEGKEVKIKYWDKVQEGILSDHKIFKFISELEERSTDKYETNAVYTYDYFKDLDNKVLKRKNGKKIKYKIRIYSKDIIDFYDELTDEEIEWANILMSENIVYQIYGGYYELPDNIEVITDNFFAWPVPGIDRITSYYGWREDPVYGGKKFHRGIDIAKSGCLGHPIIAAAPGEVISVQYKTTGYGYSVILKHIDEEDNEWTTRYAHMAQISVDEGEKIDKGKVIGAIGNTGKSTGPHLHFEIRYRDNSVDPLLLIK